MTGPPDRSRWLPAEVSAGYRGARTLVLGASGFIGRWVASYLSASDADVHIVARDPVSARETLADYGARGVVHELDLSNEADAAELVEDLRPAITFNLAGYGVDRTERDPETAFRINAEILSPLVEAIGRRPPDEGSWTRCRLVHAGSALEYGLAGGDLSEDTPPRPHTLYGRSKLAGTRTLGRVCRRLGVAGLTARLFTVYGPGEHDGRLLPSLLRAADTGETLEMTAGVQARDFTYVEDVAGGLLRLGLGGTSPGEIVNLATGTLTTVRAFAETAAEVLGIPGDRLRFGALETRPDEMAHDEIDVTRLETRTGWRPSTSVRDGVRRTAEVRRTLPPDRRSR